MSASPLPIVVLISGSGSNLQAIIDAISTKDEDLAEDIMRQHLQRGIAVLTREIEKEKQTALKIA